MVDKVRRYSYEDLAYYLDFIGIIADKTPCFSYGDTALIFFLIVCISLSSMI